MNTWTAKAHQLREAQANVLAEILLAINPDEQEQTYRTTAGGDERKLRGIPAIGRGVAGCINGLRPGDDASEASACATSIPHSIR